MHARSEPDAPYDAPRRSRFARRRRKRRSLLPKLFAAGVLLGAAIFFLPRIYDGLRPGHDIPQSLTDELQTLAEIRPEAQPLLDHPGRYPEALLELAVRNPEALDFVLDYPQKKDAHAAETVGEVRQGEFPRLLQWDEGWGYQTYGDGLMGLTGCGPTVLSMAVCGLTGDNTVTPWVVAQYAQEAGWYVDGSGSSWDLMREGCRHYGLEAEELPLDQGIVTRELNSGHPVICSMGPGDFTTSGHFILLTGVEDGQIRLNDPNRPSNSEQLWDFDTLAPQIRNLWACSPAG